MDVTVGIIISEEIVHIEKEEDYIISQTEKSKKLDTQQQKLDIPFIEMGCWKTKSRQ